MTLRSTARYKGRKEEKIHDCLSKLYLVFGSSFQGCLNRLTGGSGYRGTQGGHWLDEQSAAQLRPTQYINPASVKAVQGEEACRKCSGKVYELERIASQAGHVFHKQCFGCDGCKKSLDSTLVYSYEAKDGGVYCKRCFMERFGEGTKPLTYSDTSVIMARDGTGVIYSK